MNFNAQHFPALKKNLSPFGGLFDTPLKRKRILEIDSLSQTDPNFWSDQKKSVGILKEKKSLEEGVTLCDTLSKKFEDTLVAIEFGELGEESYNQEAERMIAELQQDITSLEIKHLLSHNLDKNNAIITVNAGAGGTEACDWTFMILRMLLRFADKKGWKTKLIDELEGDGAGLRNATIMVEGEYAYGYLKGENGVHRLVRISPFDSNARRHTSFCSVFVTPETSDDIHIEIRDADLKVDTFRAGGAGGQHINKTDSAVRMTHIPSGIIVQSQQQRSQIQNREMCLKLLKSKLYDLEVQKRKDESQNVEDAKKDNAFGSQIRSYVLHPYKLVKDLRTLVQSGDPGTVLDGELEEFCLEFLRQSAQGHFKGKVGQVSDDE